MDFDKKIDSLINQLKNIFTYNNGKLLYSSQMQLKADLLLKEIATISKTFDTGIKNEEKNIEEFLTITDKITNKRVQLISIDSMADRVKNVLEKQNVFSCLKSLALSNKCAHIFDGDIRSIKSKIEKYYSFVYLSEFDERSFTFFEDVENVLPPLKGNVYNLEKTNDYQFDKILNILFKNESVNKNTKISILMSLNVNFNKKNEEEINKKFEKILEDREMIVYSYLKDRYTKGKHLASLQSKMFSIKSNYTTMIGQLLTQDEKFSVVNYELVKTPGAVQGFEYMLIIDDKELSYYIEVHMHNFIATSLVKRYGLNIKTERETQKLGSSAVYIRDEKEIQSLLKAINSEGLNFDGIKRAKIITRGYESEDNVDANKESLNEASDYLFITDEISEVVPLIETFMILNDIRTDDVNFNREFQLNENYPSNLTKKIVLKNYLSMYNEFQNSTKIDFINYSLNILKIGDAFDKIILNNIIYDEYDIDLIGKLLINKNVLKENFIKDNKIIINDILNNETDNINLLYRQRETINFIMNDYVTNYLDDEVNKEKNKDGRTK
ncbi:MAG: hypothetical protein GX758_03675 [Tenericutes bacterium]|nr:hypothetical protein [Mycoplasmatota bacterium]